MSVSVPARLFILTGAPALFQFIFLCTCFYKTVSTLSEPIGLSSMCSLMGSYSFHLTVVDLGNEHGWHTQK